MNEMVERVAATLNRYEVAAERQSWRVLDHQAAKDAKGHAIVFVAKTWAEAKAECNRLSARAMIAAMREPTEAMVQAGYDAPMVAESNLGAWKEYQVRVDYTAMIDAALQDQPQ
jgi:hypothetical protein